MIITSALGRLLRERQLTQKQLAALTGISERAISRIKNRRQVRRIDCATAVRLCVVLSQRQRRQNRRRVRIGLDQLFPMRTQRQARSLNRGSST